MQTKEIVKAEGKLFLNIPELMDRWGVSRSTIYREIDRGRLKPLHMGNSVRFDREEVLRYERTA